MGEITEEQVWGEKNTQRMCVDRRGWRAVQEETSRYFNRRCCINRDVKHSRSSYSEEDGMQHGDRLCQLTAERRSFL